MSDDLPVLSERFERCGLEPDQARDMATVVRDMVHALAVMLEAQPDAPNFLTLTYGTPGDADDYELTIRRHGGTTPAVKIAALEDECRRLRRRLSTFTHGKEANDGE